MNKRTYVKRMRSLGEELRGVDAGDPYDPDACNRVIDEMNRTNHLWFVSLGRKHLLLRVFCWIIWLVCIAWILYVIITDLSWAFE